MRENPKVSYYPHIGIDKEGKSISPSRGHKLQIKSLQEILEQSLKLDPNKPKMLDGAIQFYQSNKLGKFNPSDPKGIFLEENKDLKWNCCFIDIDGLTKEEADNIYDKFEDFTKYLQNLVAVQKSSSYYVGGSHGIGLHFFFVIPESSEDEFLDEVPYINAAFSFTYEKLFGKEIKIDDISRQPYWRSFIHYGEYKWNDNAYCVEYTKENKKTLREKYPDYFKKAAAPSDIVYVPDENIIVNNNINTTKSIYTHQQRWIFVETLRRIKDDFDFILNTLDTFCERRHSSNGAPHKTWEAEIRKMYDDRKPIYDGAYYNAIEELEEKGVLKVRTKSSNSLKENEFMYDRKDEIVDFIKKNPSSCIVAPTGSGKTTLINGFVRRENVGTILGSDVLHEGIAEELNAVVIVPYNATNQLYDNLYEVSTRMNNNKEEIPSDRACTLVIDQAISHWDEIKNRQIIIDESHVLFADRSFRDKASALLQKMKDAIEDRKEWEEEVKQREEEKKKMTELGIKIDTEEEKKKDEELKKREVPVIRVCCVSATPLGEVDILGCVKLTYKKVRSIIKLEIINTNNIDYTLLNYAKVAEKERYYNKVVIFSDRYSKKLFENLIPIYGLENIAYMRSDLKNSEDFKNIVDTEMVNKKVTIATRVAYNGLNFNNTSDKVLILTTFKPGETLPSEIIQSIGRFRNCKVNVKCVIAPKRKAESVDKREKRAKFYDDTIEEEGVKKVFSCNYSTELLDEDKKNVLKEIEAYNKTHSTKELLIEALKDTGYISIREKTIKSGIKMVKVEDKDGNLVEVEMSMGKLRLGLKRAINVKFCNDFFVKETGVDTEFCNDDSMGGIYYTGLLRRWNNLNEIYGVDKELVKKLKGAAREDTLIDTIFSSIEDIIDVMSIPDEEWNKFMISRDAYRKTALAVLDKKHFNIYVNREDKMIEIRNTYKIESATPEDMIENALDQFVSDSLFKRNKLVEKRQERIEAIPEEKKEKGREKGGESNKEKSGKKIMDDAGEIYDSKRQLCYLKGISRSKCDTRLKNGVYKEIDIQVVKN